jgi:hypothetical protein
MFLLSNRTTGELIGEISRGDFTVIQEILEEESESDVDYYIQETALELLSQAGLSPDGTLLLTKALGDHADLEFGWEQPLQSNTGFSGVITTEGGSRPAPGLVIEARWEKERFWTFTRQNGTFELALPDQSREYLVRIVALGDREAWADHLEIEANERTRLGELNLEVLVEQN